MSSNHNISFTASDIEKYHKGLLSPKEMHALEKAAMDDPFLADALEGYNLTGLHVAADISALRSRLDERINRTKVIAMTPGTSSGSRFKVFRIAAVAAMLAIGAFVIYQVGFNKEKETPGIAAVETGRKVITTEQPVSLEKDNTGNSTTVPKGNGAINPSAPEPRLNTSTGGIRQETSGSDAVKSRSEGSQQPQLTSAGQPPREIARDQNAEEKTTALPTPEVVANRTDLKDKEDAKREMAESQYVKAGELKKEQALKRSTNVPSTVIVPNTNDSRMGNSQPYNDYKYTRPNTYRARVTDASNNAVPFANVTNVRDNNAGTFTDANGYFVLTSPDSVLNLQVHSQGFQDRYVQMRSDVNKTEQLVLQEDRNSIKEQVISYKKPDTAARNRYAKMKIEEPEPADGWDSYNTYVANNLVEPEETQNRSVSGQVEVTFEVGKNGEPTNVKVTRSLCTRCDQEAIRIVKEGPRWKRADKKGKATVIINF